MSSILQAFFKSSSKKTSISSEVRTTETPLSSKNTKPQEIEMMDLPCDNSEDMHKEQSDKTETKRPKQIQVYVKSKAEWVRSFFEIDLKVSFAKLQQDMINKYYVTSIMHLILRTLIVAIILSRIQDNPNININIQKKKKLF